MLALSTDFLHTLSDRLANDPVEPWALKNLSLGAVRLSPRGVRVFYASSSNSYKLQGVFI